MSSYQASVFKGINSRFHYKDPHNDQLGWAWITVFLPEDLHMGSSKGKIMTTITNSIMDREVVVTSRALHGMGERCISLPIKGVKLKTAQDTEELMVLAEELAIWWKDLVCAQKVSIDYHMLFQAQEPPADSDYQLLDVPAFWDKPESSRPNLWSVVVQEA